MQPVAWRWVPLFALVSCLLPLAAAAAPDAAGKAKESPKAKGSPEAHQWLLRIQSAASSINYRGMMVFSAGGNVSNSRVGHYVVGSQTFEVVEAMDGREQRVLRHNDNVVTLWPQTKRALSERRESLVARSTTPQMVEVQALEQYEFRREGLGRVANRDAVVFTLAPRDALRYVQRLWADQATGLMLRADVYEVLTAVGERPPLESTSFSEVAINVPPPDGLLQQIRDPRKLDGYRVVNPQQKRTTLEAEGWAIGRAVPGFSLAGCLSRGMESAGDKQPPVLQAVFTDGLTHVSLFIEPFDAQRHRGEMTAQQGATATLLTRRGEHWITAVGDVPPATLKLFADALERRRP